MPGMLQKFIGGAAEAGADILKQGRLQQGELEKQTSLEKLRAQIQNDLLQRQQEFAAGMAQRQQQFQKEMQERALGQQREIEDIRAQRESERQQRLLEQSKMHHQETMARLDRQLALAMQAADKNLYALGVDPDNNLRMGKWDTQTGKLMAGGIELQPPQKAPDIKQWLDLAKFFADNNMMDKALASLAFGMRGMGGKPIKLPQVGMEKNGPEQNGQEAEEPRPSAPQKRAPSWRPLDAPVSELDSLEIQYLQNLARQEPNSERGRLAAQRLRELAARRESQDQTTYDIGLPQ